MVNELRSPKTWLSVRYIPVCLLGTAQVVGIYGAVLAQSLGIAYAQGVVDFQGCTNSHPSGSILSEVDNMAIATFPNGYGLALGIDCHLGCEVAHKFSSRSRDNTGWLPVAWRHAGVEELAIINICISDRAVCCHFPGCVGAYGLCSAVCIF